MNEFWKTIMEEFLSVLYYGAAPEEGSGWTELYATEVSHMIQDILEYRRVVTESGQTISNEGMAQFLIYAENLHIGNSKLIKKNVTDMNHITTIAATINDELNQ